MKRKKNRETEKERRGDPRSREMRRVKGGAEIERGGGGVGSLAELALPEHSPGLSIAGRAGYWSC